MKRNTLFAGLSLVVAGAAIGAGAIVSSNAMADSGTPDNSGVTLTVISASTDGGQPIECTYTGVDLPSIAVAASEVAPIDPTAGGEVVNIASVGADGTVTLTGPDGGPPTIHAVEGDTSGVIEITNTAEGTSVAIGGPIDAGSMSVSVSVSAGADPTQVMPSADNARPGTAEECDALKPGAPLGS